MQLYESIGKYTAVKDIDLICMFYVYKERII